MTHKEKVEKMKEYIDNVLLSIQSSYKSREIWHINTNKLPPTNVCMSWSGRFSPISKFAD